MMDAASEGVHTPKKAAHGVEDKVRAIIEAVPIPVVVTRASDGVVLYASSRIGPAFGVTSDDVVGRPAADFYTDGPSHEELLARLRECGGYVHDLELSGRKVDGTPAWVVVSIQEMEYGGEPALLTAIHDVTERKRAEEALRESEERYRHLVEEMNEGLGVQDEKGLITYVNDRLCEILRRSRDELIGLPITAIIHEDGLAAFKMSMTARREGRGTSYELAYKTKDGEKVMTLTSGQPLFGPEGEPRGSFAVITDISERKRAEVTLRESETKFRTLAETMPAVVGIFQGGHIRYLSRAAEAVTGYSCEELLAIDFLDVIHPDYRDLVRERGLARERGDQVSQGYEVKIVTKGGDERWLVLAGAAIEYEGKPAEIATALDITERKQMEAELERIRETLDSTTERQMQRGNLSGLTFREVTVLNLITEGKADKEIATILGISFLTARKHTANILGKMGVASRTQAAVEAIRQGLLG